MRTILAAALLLISCAPLAIADPTSTCVPSDEACAVQTLDAPWATSACAQPSADVQGCASEQRFGTTDCPENDTWGYHSDGAGAALFGTYVDAGGHQACSRYGDSATTEQGIQLEAYGPLAGIQTGWFSFDGTGGSGCAEYVFVYVLFVGQGSYAPCVAGDPPNPGWGTFLP